MILQYTTDDDLLAPRRATDGAAGYDLCSAEDVSIMPGHHWLVKTGVSVQLPENTAGLIWARSGLALRNGMQVMGGVIDQDYRGEIGVILYNASIDVFNIMRGDRIAQLLIQPVFYPEAVKVNYLSSSRRASDGFGSTGVSNIKPETD